MKDGVLGCEVEHGEITLIDGWDWFTNDQQDNIQSDQYDFQTVVTHELRHALGLTHSLDPNSVMYWKLPSGVAQRGFTSSDRLALAFAMSEHLEDSEEGALLDQSVQPIHEFPCTCGLEDRDPAPLQPGHLMTLRNERDRRLSGQIGAMLFVVGDDTLDVGGNLVGTVDYDEFLIGVPSTKTSSSATTGDDVLVGGDGVDQQIGRSGHDVLVGGFASSGESAPMAIDQERNSYNDGLVSPSVVACLDGLPPEFWSDQQLDEFRRVR
jgi:hypothetical protein